MTVPNDQHFELLVIGSGPAGVSAAQGYLDAGGAGPVLLVTADADPPYQRPPLSKDVLAGESPVEGQPINDDGLPDGVQLRLNTTVTEVDLTSHVARLHRNAVPGAQGAPDHGAAVDGGAADDGADDVAFHRLVVTTGAQPNPLPTAEDDADVHVLRSLELARELVTAAEQARSAVVIGSGFIGCEAAASLAKRGLDVTLVTPEDGPQAKRLGGEASERLAGWLTDAGVQLRTGVAVTNVTAPRTVHLDDESTLSPDLVLAAVGVTPSGHLMRGTGARVVDGRIAADENLAAAPDVWVAGDVSHAQHAIAERVIEVEHWGDALAMGELAGRNAATGDDQKPWESVPGFWSTIGDHTIKYSAWGDGFDSARLVEHDDGFTVWYGSEDGELVGVLTYNADDDYERGQELLARRAALAEA